MKRWQIIFAIIVGIMGTAAVAIPILNGNDRRSKEVVELREIGKRSPAHQFVADKFIDCRSEIPAPSQDACVARIVNLSRVKCPEFEGKVSGAIRDIGLE